ESTDSLLPQAFALVREASRRTLGQRHFDVQLMGGIVLHEGKIAEMMTGEGKTLAATLPAYLNALSGKGVHVVTVNDYLAKRDAIWMGQIYYALGLSVSCIVHDSAYVYDPSYTRERFEIKNSKSEINHNDQNSNGQKNELDKQRDLLGSFKVFEEFLRPISRREAYLADITYGTNHEFGFDYLRDNLVLRLGDKVQREHYYAIIDEVDSILIDEARTPLIISAPDVESSSYYRTFAKLAERLSPEDDYVVDEKLRVVNITNAGIDKVEKMLGIDNIFGPENVRLVHFLQESLRAKALFRRDRDYVVRDGEVIIVDEFTGRMLLGRRYSGGLHQAIEAKEGVAVKEENRTYAQITIQNYFRLYKKIAGMTGTASTSAEEFHKVYGLDVVTIPTNKPLIRIDLADVVYKTKDAKFKAVAEDVKRRHEKGQPVLLGTASINHNELLSDYLKRVGVPHEILNAKNHEREGEIIAQGGRVGAVTVATNIAGRGVDIVLGGNPPVPGEAEKVRELGGLHVIGTERHEARRIDNQLRGRSGRQGDPGSTQFFLSLEDDLLRVFGGDRIKKLMETLNFPEDLPIESRMVSKSVNQAQARVEGANLDIRRHLLDFDDVLNKQRIAIYNKRMKILEAGEKGEIRPYLFETLAHFVGIAEEGFKKGIESGALKREDEEKIAGLRQKLNAIPEKIEPERAQAIGQHMVRILDSLWISHLENLEALRDSVNIRAYGQHEPLVEYRREAHKLYTELNLNFETLTFNTVFQFFEGDASKFAKGREEEAKRSENMRAKAALGKKIGRNDPCWCGSGKKYKKCHGK
ncbi:MAG TPA: preprotein translocase subunit SecA, partial [Candidatus Paceibacterota bacterium]|nr:preprotein translocase subunit SecA [Candidatus Paceibacterota bacterium]